MKLQTFRCASHARNNHGSLGMLIPCAILFVILAVGSFAADLVHHTLVRAELQNATDAAALAGASALVTTTTAPLASYYATSAAALNYADGDPVSNTARTTVDVRLNTNVPQEIGQCQVKASCQIQNWLSPIFGRDTDKITVCSTAACSSSINGVAANILFPIAVSLDAAPNNKNVSKLPLRDLKLGDTFSIFINSQQVKNGAFTSMGVKNTNANWINQAINQTLGISPSTPNFIPAVHIGDPIFLDNGVAGQKTLAGEPRLSALKGKNIAIPVIEGQPPFNQSRPVVGWVVIKVTSVEVNKSGGVVEVIEGTLVKVPIRGSSGPIATPGNLQAASPSSVRLIANTQDFPE